MLGRGDCGVLAGVWGIRSSSDRRIDCDFMVRILAFFEPQVLSINRKRMTVIDLLIILAICAILYGLTLPAVGSGQHRRPVVPVVPSGTNATQANGGAESPK